MSNYIASPVLATPILLFKLRARWADCLAVSRSAIFKLGKLSVFLRQEWLRVFAIAIVAIAVRSPALQGDRIWDDNYLAHDNPFIKSPLLILEAFRHYLFLDSFSAHYRPVQNISYIIDYFFWNTDTYGFHLTNVLLHAGSGIVLYFLLRQLFVSLLLRGVSMATRARLKRRLPWISIAAFLVAIIWVVHPVHSAAVDYISGRADSLAFLFAAGAWLLFLRAQSVSRIFVRTVLYSLAAIGGLLALLSREIACVWIILFLAHLFLVEKNCRWRLRLGTLACCLSLVLIYAGLRHLPQQRPPSPLDFRNSAPVRAVLMARSLGDYGRLMIFPANLHMERTVESDHGDFGGNAGWRRAIATEYLSILGLVVLAALIFGCIKKGRAQTLRIFGASWFIAGFLPISNIVQLNATAAEHWLYLPSVGFLIWVFGCTFEMPTCYRRIVPALAAIAVIVLGARSVVRSGDWVNEETFYKRTFEAGSRSARVAINLGQIYANRGAYAKAERIFRLVLEQNPQYPIAQTNLADVLFRQGKKAQAEAIFALSAKDAEQTRKEYPRTWIAAVNQAYLRHKANDDKEAFSILESARAAYPGVWEIISYESELLRETQGPDAALRLVEQFAGENWWHYGASVALGRLYAQKGDVDLAYAALRHASWLDVHDAEALNLIAAMRMRQNRFEEACRTQRRAISRQPDEPRQYILLSNILEKMGRGNEARSELAKASHLCSLAQKQTIAN
jgi:Flp pilus assembly protein TadD